METLIEKGSRWAKALRDGRTGPLVIAEEVVELTTNWDKKASNGLEATTWLRRYVGERLAFFEERAEAVQILGESIRRHVDHNVAVTVVRYVKSPELRTKIVEQLIKHSIANRGVPLNSSAAKRKVIFPVTGWKKLVDHKCNRCEQLEAELALLRGRDQAAE